jgi:hypothetical protein
VFERYCASRIGEGLGIFRRSPRLRACHVHYEKAGLSVADEPIPWNAEAVVVEAVVESAKEPDGAEGEFRLNLTNGHVAKPVAVCPQAADGVYRVRFRLDPPPRTDTAILSWRAHGLGQAPLPHLKADDFLGQLRLEEPTVFARLGESQVACRAVVEGQANRLLAGGVLRSPTALLPLLGFPLVVELANECTGYTRSLRVPFAGFQAGAREALLTVPLPDVPAGPGTWSVRWAVAERVLARSEFRVISRQAFRQSLYLPDGGRGAEEAAGPAADLSGAVFGGHPRFRVASREPGLAAVCPLDVRVHFQDPDRPPVTLTQEVLVTDVPSLCLPAQVDVGGDAAVEAFELFSVGRYLGRVLWVATPAATFNGEGGFRASPDFDWTPTAEAELNERLSRLAAAPAP